MTRSQQAQDIRAEILNGESGHRIEVHPIAALKNRLLAFRELRAGEVLDMRKASTDENGLIDERRFSSAAIIAATIHPETHEQIFDPADRDPLFGIGLKLYEELGKLAMRMNAVNGADDGAIIKNSVEPEAMSGTPSGSPNGSG